MNTNTLKIIQHNVRSWNTNKTALTNIYNTLDPHIILINETSITNNNTFKIFNYNTHYCNKNNTRNRGVGIAIKHNIQYRLHDDFETDILAVTLHTQQGPITIGTSYIPPSATYLHTPDYNTLFNRPEPTYYLGDMNARHPTFRYTNNTSIVGRNLNTFITLNKATYIGPNFPTLIRHNSASSPDIVLTNTKTFHNIHLTPGPITPSDHIPIIATISINPIQIPILPRKSFHKADWEGYTQHLSHITPPTDPHPTLEDIDTELDSWTKHIKEASDLFIPTIKYRTVPGIKPTHNIKLIQIQYNAAMEHFRYNGPSPQLNTHINNLKHQLQHEYRTLQSQVWNNIIHNIDIEHDPTRFWHSIKRLQGNNKQGIPYIRDQHNNKIHKTEDKETLFREHWGKIFSHDDLEDADFDYEHIHDIEHRVANIYEDTLRPYDTGDISRLQGTFPPISLHEIQTTLRKFKHKAPGPTQITTLHLKHLPRNMLHYIQYIYNMSISAGYFPDTFKHAHMIFIPKGNTSQYNIKNYRPISLLDIQGKLLDKILNTRLTQHLETHNYTNSRQHGFRKHRGTHTALSLFYETISTTLAQQHKTNIILRDVAKAFDKVWHIGLKYKLSQIGLHNCFTRTLTDYITDRTASIRLNTYIGPPFELNSGVPQGACLSPTLYSFYTHDMPPPTHDTDYIAFADDITQIASGRYTHPYAAQTTQLAIEQINTYEKKWKIQTNTSKFNIIPLVRTKTLPITIDDTELPYTSTGKILGLTFGTRGIHQHVQNRTNIAQASLTKLFRFRDLTQKNKIKLYTAIVRSQLIYPTVPLNTITPTQTRKLQRVQNRALRFITNTSRLDRKTSHSLHTQCNVPPINILIHEQAQTTWEHFRDNLPDIYNTLTQQITPQTPRHSYFPSSRLLAEGPTPPPIYT